MYITKDSGKRSEYSTGMVRDLSEGKIRFDLIMELEDPTHSMLWRWAELMTRGAEKYEARNWEKASTQQELDRARESAFRHFMQWFSGIDDEDHAAAVFFNINEVEYIKRRLKCNK